MTLQQFNYGLSTSSSRTTPGPIAMECLALAREAVNRAEANPGCTKHVYRSQDESKNEELWQVGPANREWKMHVDCAGFVRKVLETTLKRPFTVALSDRSFMRAKDFFAFFEHIPSLHSNSESSCSSCWRRVEDLRTILPGDIITYRHKGRAAGGAAFLEMSSLYSLFKALKVKELYEEEAKEGDGLVHRNIAQDKAVAGWTEYMVQSLAAMGIASPDDLRGQIEENSCVNDLMLRENVDVTLLKEALSSKAHDTGHVMFAAGRAERVETSDNKWRIHVYQSTAAGPVPGVQRGYRTFTVTEHGRWIWEGDTNILGVPDEVLAARLLS